MRLAHRILIKESRPGGALEWPVAARPSREDSMAKDVAKARGWLEGYLTNPSRIRDRLGVVLDSAEDGGDVGGGLI